MAINIRQQIKEIALGKGVEAEVAEQLAQKCYDDIQWRPYGGAKSFAEVEAAQKASEAAAKINMDTYMLESIVGNITSDSEMGADEKANAIKGAADEYKDRISKSDEKSLIQKFKEFLTGEDDKIIRKVGNKYVLYSQSGKRLGEFESREAAEKRERQINFFKHQGKELVGIGFKVYLDSEGSPRWMSTSSNAFEDHDHELFTTKALEEAVEYADKSGERGPLLVYHVPAAEIGQCDLQAVVGRFLVESGSFNDTPLGQKALEYFVESDEDHQVSIGYDYRVGDEEDGQYDWLRIKERSVTPYGAAANPWTSFKIIGEEKMDAIKAANMEKVFGKELAAEVISRHEAATKELEQTIRFKEKKPEVELSLTNLGTLVKSLPDGDTKAKLIADYEILEKAMKGDEEDEEDDDEKKGKKEESTTEVTTPEVTAPDLVGIGAMLISLTDKVDALKIDSLAGVPAKIEELEKSIKELQKTDEQKMDNSWSRWSGFDNQKRPSESDKNVVTEAEVKEMVGVTQESEQNPAAPYIRDLFRSNGVGA